MVDYLQLFGLALGVTVLLPTLVLIVGRIVSFFVSFTATGSVTLEPEGPPQGKALIVYEPGATGMTRQAADRMGNVLQGREYEVTIAGIRSPAIRDTAGYRVLLIGTPTYLGRITGPVTKYLRSLEPVPGQIVGLFPTGVRGMTPEGAMPSRIVDALIEPLREKSVDVKVITYIGYRPFDYEGFVARLLD